MSVSTAAGSEGQALLIGVMIGTTLALCVPVIILVNQINAAHQARVERRGRADASAAEALAYAETILAAHWTFALNGPPYTAVHGLADCNGGPIAGAGGAWFKLDCQRPASAEPYQVRVVATALARDGGLNQPLRAWTADLSAQTLSVSLPDDIQASVALEMMNAPAPGSRFAVHWGPWSCLDHDTPVDITATPMDAQRFPRKFCVNGLNASAPARGNAAAPTDLREFWTYQAVGLGPPIDDAAYRLVAKSESALPAPGCAGVCASPIAGIGTGFWTPAPGDRVVLEGSVFNNSVLASSAVIYVDGDAELDNFRLDLQRGGALIVTHDLYLSRPGAGMTPTLRLPPRAALEYPLAAALSETWPCDDAVASGGAACASTDPHPPLPIGYRGFLWAKHNLLVESAGWAMAGSALIGDPAQPGNDGRLEATHGTFTLFYDDRVNRQIRVGAVRLQHDALWATAAR